MMTYSFEERKETYDVVKGAIKIFFQGRKTNTFNVRRISRQTGINSHMVLKNGINPLLEEGLIRLDDGCSIRPYRYRIVKEKWDGEK